MNIIKRIIRKIIRILKSTKKEEVIRSEVKCLNKSDIEEQLLQYDVISFDVFDTLITRKIYNPDDVFALIDKKVNIKVDETYLQIRKNAERHANSKYGHDVNIDEIYEAMKELYSFKDSNIKKYKQMEIDLELELCYPKTDMINILKMLKKNNKKVILTSDMYLTKNIISKMLAKCGIDKKSCYDEFYLSNEIDKRKDSGTMWEYLLSKYDKNKFVHVGDNKFSDYDQPIKYGLNAIYIPNAREMVSMLDFNNVVKKHIERNNLNNSLYLGYLVNCQLFNSPFVKNISSVDTLSKVYHAPMLYQYLKFIHDNTRKNETLLFLAREGYYLEKIYDEYNKIFNKKSNNHCYFLASRKATMSSLIATKEDLEKAVNIIYEGTISKFFKDIFELDYDGEDFHIKLPDDYDKVISIFLKKFDEIKKVSDENKNNYLTYINSKIDYKKDNPVIIDLGYSGTIQYNLSKILKKDLKGIYLTNSDSVKRYSNKSKLLFCFDITDDQKFVSIYHYSLLLEYFLTAPYGQLQRFVKKGNKVEPIYNEESISENKQKCIDIIYDGIISFFKDMKELLNIDEIVLDNELLADIYTSIIESNLIDISVKDQFTFIDVFNENIEKNVFKIISRY